MSEVPDGLHFGSVTRKQIPSATLMVTRDGPSGVEVLLGHRADSMPAFPGYWAFPGGGVSRVDRAAVADLEQLEGPIDAAIAAMMRELVEELGLAPLNGELVSVDAAARASVVEDKANWLPLVKEGKIPCDPTGIRHISSRTTPPFAPVQFVNTFLHIHAEEKTPEFCLAEQTEFEDAAWYKPSDLIEAWKRHEVKVAPPVVTLLMEVDRCLSLEPDMDKVSEDLSVRKPGRRSILFANGVEVVPVKTATLPPADHTNSYLVGKSQFVLVDPACRMREAMEELADAVDRHEGELVGIVFTHSHSDHLADLDLLREAFDAPIWGSEHTAKSIACDRILQDGEVLDLGGQEWTVVMTHGHHPGHVCLLSEAGLVAGDMVAGIGTILIPPHSGDMTTYLSELEMLLGLEPHLIFPAHGPVIPLPEKKLKYYLKHRSKRHQRVLDAVSSGLSDLGDIATEAYADTPDAHPSLAIDQTLSHLISHEREGSVKQEGNAWFIA